MAKVMLKRVGILSVAKWQCFLSLLFGFITGIIFGAYAYMVTGLTVPQVLIIYLILFPIAYGVIGFVSSLIGGVIYNSLAGTVGGMLMEFEEVPTEKPLPPPPPSFQ